MAAAERAPADTLSDEWGAGDVLFGERGDGEDRESEDFHADLAEVQQAYANVCDAYDSAIAVLPEQEQSALRKNFDLAVVGLRDKLVALEKEAGV